MARFMLILHESPNPRSDASPEELQRIFEKYRSWMEKIQATGRLVVSDKLKEEGGKVLATQNGKVSVIDGPYSEAREVVGGYFTLRAENYEEVIELARDCPHLHYGRIEIRQADPQGCGGP